jgi:class 3 adenylate cyclase
MSKLNIPYHEIIVAEGMTHSLNKPEFNTFTPNVLGLGDISKDAKYQEAMAVVFDLEGFTSFCSQIEPHLVVPEFLRDFLFWLFDEIAKESIQSEKDNVIVLWNQLPFYAKFTGDGILFLWDTSTMYPVQMGNVVTSFVNIINHYQSQFLPRIRKVVSKAPSRLRCGVARGQVISIGNGEDYVGACINVASRIQKLSSFSLAFSRRGFSIERHFMPSARDKFQLIRTPIRGLGDEELIYVTKEEFKKLEKTQQDLLIV